MKASFKTNIKINCHILVCVGVIQKKLKNYWYAYH